MKKGWRNTDDIDSFIKEARLRKNIQKAHHLWSQVFLEPVPGRAVIFPSWL